MHNMAGGKYEYVVFKYAQRTDEKAPVFCLFHAPAYEVLKWAAINRLDRTDPLAIQRDPKKSRIAGIKRFFALDDRNTIPTAVVLTLGGRGVTQEKLTLSSDSDASFEDLWRLTIEVPVDASEGDKPGLVIDGQHRLKGVADFDESTHLNVVVLLEADDDEKAFQFLVINNKAAKVSPDHIRALSVQHTDNLPARLLTARLAVSENVSSVQIADTEEGSPFNGLVDWPRNWIYKEGVPHKEGFVVPSAIEGAISHIKSRRVADLDDEETVDDFFLAIWSAVKVAWRPQFRRNSAASPTKLLEKVSIITLTEFLVGELMSISRSRHSRFSLSDMEKVSVHTRELLECLSPEFWVVGWKSTSYDTRAGRDLLVEAIEGMYGNLSEGREWHEGLDSVVELST